MEFQDDEIKDDVLRDLLDQLESNGIYGRHYVDMIDKYMDFWTLHKRLQKVIKDNDTMFPTTTGFKVNPAIDALNKNNTQMLKILTTLGLKAPATQSVGDGDDDEM